MHLSIDYNVSPSGHRSRDNLLTEAEMNAEAGRLRAKHLAGIFTLLRLIDVPRYFQPPPEIGQPYMIRGSQLGELSDHLSAIGELGVYLADSLYGNICELDDLYNDVTTFVDEPPITQ